jgi:hypothetical protein
MTSLSQLPAQNDRHSERVDYDPLFPCLNAETMGCRRKDNAAHRPDETSSSGAAAPAWILSRKRDGLEDDDVDGTSASVLDFNQYLFRRIDGGRQLPTRNGHFKML